MEGLKETKRKKKVKEYKKRFVQKTGNLAQKIGTSTILPSSSPTSLPF